jgi:hypothetical protein
MVDESTGIWSLDEAKQSHYFDEPLAEAIVSRWLPKRAVDLGCGPGWYAKAMQDAGWEEVEAYEGTPDIESIAVHKPIQAIDLSKPIEEPSGFFDFVLCLEVGEHIPTKCEADFLDNLAILSSSIIVLSWAVPGQTGVGHVNERPNYYVISELSDRGFRLCPRSTERLRQAASLPWFRDTLLVFIRNNGSLRAWE